MNSFSYGNWYREPMTPPNNLNQQMQEFWVVSQPAAVDYSKLPTEMPFTPRQEMCYQVGTGYLPEPETFCQQTLTVWENMVTRNAPNATVAATASRSPIRDRRMRVKTTLKCRHGCQLWFDYAGKQEHDLENHPEAFDFNTDIRCSTCKIYFRQERELQRHCKFESHEYFPPPRSPNSRPHPVRPLTKPEDKRKHGFVLVVDLESTTNILRPVTHAFSCRCGVFFTSGDSLAEHIRTVLDGNVFECKWCDDLQYKTVQALNRHIQKKHPEIEHTEKRGCKLCGYTAATPIQMREHKKLSHIRPNDFQDEQQSQLPTSIYDGPLWTA